MTTYFIRRLMLVPITFLAITFMVYSVLRVVPGGPIEQAEAAMRLQAASGEGGRGGGGGLADESGLQLDESALRELESYYALDRSVPVGYLQWLGVWPREQRSLIPPVDRTAHAEALARLEAERERVRQAERELGAVLEPAGLVEASGRIGRPVPAEEVPAEVRETAERLALRTFGEQEPLRRHLDEHGFLRLPGGRYARAVPQEKWPAGVAGKMEGLEALREARRVARRETGYYLRENGRPMQLAFRPLLELVEVREEATGRIQRLLEPRGERVFKGTVYRQMTDEEVAAFLKTDAGGKARDLVASGFGKRDELLDDLREQGRAWHANQYYRVLTQEEWDTDRDLYATIEALIAARNLANRELATTKEQEGLEATEEGRLYRIETRRSGVLQLDFGKSYTYNEPVVGVVGARIKISLWFGLTGYILTWLVCVPLGVFKAVKHRSFFDTATSVVVFIGYSIPGFVLVILLLTKAKEWGLPLGGFEPEGVENMGPWEAFIGRARHMVIPVAGYMVASFAAMTILMKNSLLENLSQDYVRTAFAKGLSEKRVIFVHALRNSLIPITAGIGHALGLLFAGSFLIEKAANIPGMGLLGYHAILQRDYPIILALLVFLVLIRLFGNILSDIIWALIDPRIRFG